MNKEKKEKIKELIRSRVLIYPVGKTDFDCPACGCRLVSSSDKATCPNPECEADFTTKLVIPELKVTDPYIFLELC